MTTLQDRILFLVADPSDQLLAQFFDVTGPFAATTFDTLADNPPDRFTAADLLAVTLLDVALSSAALRSLLVTETQMYNELLAAVPADLDLWDASDDVLAQAEQLYWALRKLPLVGRTRASKLMARKRPRLIPIIDSVLHSALALGDNSWSDLRVGLSNPAIRSAIENTRPESTPAETISTLRLLDAAVWMRCSQSRNARSARRLAGMRE